MFQEIFSENEKKALELKVRRDIYELVRKFAGCHFREIERKSQLATGSLRYHLTFLLKNELINEVGEGNTVRYFPKGFSSDNKKLLGLLRQKSIRGILLFILTHNNCNHEQIVKAIRLSPSTVSWHLKKLNSSDIIHSEKKGRMTHFSLISDKQEIMKLLIAYQESFFDSIVDNVVEMWDGI
jgi:predicted transcriptional regulator